MDNAVYTSLPVSEGEIRLLSLSRGWYGHGQLRGRLVKRRLNKGDTDESLRRYTALSYTWGEATPFDRLHLQDGFSLSITKNLSDVLRQFRNPFRAVFLWIDQVCINQNNLQEKSQQVRQMHLIYSKASTVFVWLGPHTESSKLALRFRKQFIRALRENEKRLNTTTEDGENKGAPRSCIDFDSRQEVTVTLGGSHATWSGAPTGSGMERVPRPNVTMTNRIGEAIRNPYSTLMNYYLMVPRPGRIFHHGGEGRILPDRHSDEWMAMKELLSRPWFTRIWVIQEAFANGVEPFFLIGGTCLPWVRLYELIRLLRANLPPFYFGPHVDADSGLPAEMILHIDMLRRDKQEGNHVYLHNVMQRYRRCLASDPRDKVYAMYSLANIDGPFSYEAKSEDLYVEFAVSSLRAIDDIVQGRVALGPLTMPGPVGAQALPCIPATAESRLSALIMSAGLSKRTLDLPSWVPDWSYHALPHLFPGCGVDQAKITYAAGYKIPRFQILGSNSKPVLGMVGMIIDTVSSSTEAHIKVGEPLEIPFQQAALASWCMEAARIAKAHLEERADIKAELGSTMSQNRWRAKPFLEKEEYTDRTDIYQDAKWLDFSKSKSFSQSEAFDFDYQVYWESIPYISGRSFIALNEGGFGLGPIGTLSEDAIALIAGINLPLVLRPTGDGGYRLVGECSLQDANVMQGKVWANDMDSASKYSGRAKRYLDLV